jgi:hypothetical protein
MKGDCRVTVVSSGVQHPGRFALAAVLLGLLWYWLVIMLASYLPRPWDEFQGDSHPLVVLSFVLGILALSWCSRRQVAALRVRWTLPVAVLGLVVGSLVIGGLLFTSVYLGGGSVEEVRMESSLPGKLIWAVICVLHIAVQGVVGVAMNALLSIPLAWATVLCLRWASGGRPEAGTAPSES